MGDIRGRRGRREHFCTRTFFIVLLLFFFAFAFANKGRMYAWGENYVTRLGLGDGVDRLTPTMHNLPSTLSMVQIAAGDREMFAPGKKKEVYWNAHFEKGGSGGGKV